MDQKKAKRRKLRRRKQIKTAFQLWRKWKNGIDDRDIDEYLMKVEKNHLSSFPEIKRCIKMAKHDVKRFPEKARLILSQWNTYIDEWVEKYRAGTVSELSEDEIRLGYDEIVKEIRMGNIDLASI